jgi:hypothetical protein
MARGFRQLVYEMSYFGIVQTHEFVDVGKRQETARRCREGFRLCTAEEARESKCPIDYVTIISTCILGIQASGVVRMHFRAILFYLIL